ncbi:hypothetical protein SESBI_42405 [Sesbania bispinosa]|nr:hypothetical protein SESBI_42405 [Sesbania bispinosa]
MANYAIDHNCEVNLVIKHVSVAVLNLIESLLELESVKETQVQKSGNCDGQQVKGVNREDKGKAVEVGDERRGPIEAMDTDLGSEESIDGSLEDFCFDDSEDERNFGSDDGFGEVEMQNLATEETPNTKGIPHIEGTQHTEGTPHIVATLHNEGTS